MRATSIGHAGILVDTVDGSIACDPWFLPQFHGSWFVFPRNDQLSPERSSEYPIFKSSSGARRRSKKVQTAQASQGYPGLG